MKRKIIRLFVFAVAAFAAIKTTTLGWIFWNPRAGPSETSQGSVANLKRHVEILAGEIGPRDMFSSRKSLEAAADYISSQLKTLEYDVERRRYPVAGSSAENIIAVKRGMVFPEETIIVGAHYDTCSNPGADDNSSGVAGMLELAERFSKKTGKRTLKFIAFVNEEPPFFKTKDMGSFAYAESAFERGENIKLAVILEMIGYFSEKSLSQRYPPLLGPFFPNKGNFIAQVSDFKTRKLAKRMDAAFKKASSLPVRTVALPSFVPGVDFSDHWSFWQKEYKAVMFTDTAFYRNPNYHKKTDTPETLNYEYMSRCVDGVEAALGETLNE